MNPRDFKELQDKFLSNRPRYNEASNSAISLLVLKKSQQSISSRSRNKQCGGESKNKLFRGSLLKDADFHQNQNGGCFILDHLNPVLHNLETIDLSNNNIGFKGIVSLCEAVGSSWCRVAILKLVNCSLTDNVIEKLGKTMCTNISVCLLNISNNRAASKSLSSLGSSLKTNNTLKELNLAWNKCYGCGLQDFSQGLLENRTLRRLNIGSNMLGKVEDRFSDHSNTIVGEPIKALSNAIANNTTLTHLDLSNCNLSSFHCEQLAEGLHHNHTITGLHFEGNKGVVDAKGFIVLEGNISLQPDYSFFSAPQGDAIIGISNQCWECRKWIEQIFEFNVQESVTDFSPMDYPIQVYLHLSIDAWRADLMEQTNYRHIFQLARMIPIHTRVWYFFSCEGEAVCDSRKQVEIHPRLQVLRNFLDSKPSQYEDSAKNSKRKQQQSEEETHHTKSASLHQSTIGEHQECAVQKIGDFVRTAKPRAKPFMPNEEIKVGCSLQHLPPRWDIKLSVFAARQKSHGDFYSHGLVSQAVESDFSFSKIKNMKLLETEQEITDFKTLLSTWYIKLDCCFHYFTGHDHVSDPFSIQWQEFKVFCEKANILDTGCTISDVQKMFKVSNVELEEAAALEFNNDNTLERFEFLELLLRIAMRKFKQKETSSKKCFEMLLKENIDPLISLCEIQDPDSFRQNFLYTKLVEDTLIICERRLRWVFEDYSIKIKKKIHNNLHGRVRRMTYDSFCGFLDDTKLSDLDQTKTAFMFKISQPIATEIKSGLQTSIDYVDFLECLCRLFVFSSMSSETDFKNGTQFTPSNITSILENGLEQWIQDILAKLVYEDPYEGRFIRKISKTTKKTSRTSGK